MIALLLMALAAPGDCACEPLAPGDPVAVLMSEQTCSLKLAPVTRALEECNRVVDAQGQGLTDVSQIPPPPAPPPRLPLVVGALVGSSIGAGFGAGIVLTDTDQPIPIVLGAASGAVAGSALGALIGWIVGG